MNKFKKLTLLMLLGLSSAITISGIAACDNNPEEQPHTHEYNWSITKPATCKEEGEKKGTCSCGDEKTEVIEKTAHTAKTVEGKDATCVAEGLTEGSVCEVCGETLTAQQKIPATGKHVYDNDQDPDCNVCGATREVATYSEVTFEMNGHGTAPDAQNVKNGEKATKPQDPTADGYTFDGWYADEQCNTPFDFDNQAITSATVIYAKWTKNNENADYEMVTTVLDIQTLHDTYGEGVKLTEDVTFGKFKFGKGLYFNQSTGDLTGPVINNQKKLIYFTLEGVDNSNSIQFDVKTASSSTGNLSLYNSKDEVVKDFGDITSTMYALKAENLPAGTYYLKSAGSLRFGQISVTEKLEKSSAVSISVKGGVTKELQGRQFSYTGLTVSLNYSNGRVDTITSGFTVDSGKVDMNTPGVYPVTVSYATSEGATPFTATYEIAIFSIDSITLSDHSINKSRVTMPVQKVFVVGEVFNSTNLAVRVECSAPNSDKTQTFILDASEYAISAVDNQTAGTKTVTVTVGNKTATYDVYYVDKTNADINNVIVDSNATGISMNAEGVYTVNSINKAIQLFKAFGTAAEEAKTVTVKEGEYYEKVEIDIPNVKLIGQGSAVLWCDILAGQVDPSGTSAYSTDGSASVSIREGAVGFYAENITFKNYYNTHDLYTYSKTLMTDTQAVACLVQADKSYFKNCTFTSYHDTLYAMYGRQVYDNCYIEGRTDYIFGADATCYFKGCTIKTIYGKDSKNGGYICATKGTNGLLYGYIFDGCTLTAEDEMVDGTVSLARGWDVYMTLAFINCNISSAYSKEYYGEATLNEDGTVATDNKNDRYISMNVKPVPAQLFEYNNTGAGALTEAQIASADANGLIDKMCTYLTAEQAAQYSDLSIIFAQVQKRMGATDYTTPYTDSWDGSAGAKITSLTYDFAIFEQNYAGTTVQEYFKNDMTIAIPEDIAKPSIRWNGNSVQFDIGTKITFNTKGKIYVDWYGGNYGNAANGVITYKDGYATLTIVTTPGNSGVYIKNIKLNLEEVPEDTVNYNVTFNYGYEDAPAAEVVSVPGGNFVAEPATPVREGYEFAGWYIGDDEYDFKTLVNGELTLTAKWNEVTDMTITEDTVYNFAGANAYSGGVSANETKKWQKMVMDGGTSGSFSKHNDGWFTLKGNATLTFTLCKGATITFTTYDGHLVINGVTVAADQYVTDNGMKYTYTVEADGEVVVSMEAGASQVYLSLIEIETTDALLKTLDKDAVAAGAKYKYDGTVNNTEYFVLRNCATNGDWLRIEQGGKITFFVEAGATITIGGSQYDGADTILSIGSEELTKDAANVWTYKSELGGKIELVNSSASGVIYIKTITVKYDVQEENEENPEILKPLQTVLFGTNGNYNNYIANGKIKVVGQIRDNADNNSQIADGATITLQVKAYTAVCISGYNGYTNYTVKVNGAVVSGESAVTDSTWIYVPKTDATVEIISGSNNYFYSIMGMNSGAFTYKFSEEAANYADGDAIEPNGNFIISGCVRHSNQYVALKDNNAITFILAAGSTLKIHMPYSSGVTVNGTEVTLENDYLVYTATEDGVVTVSGTAGKAYFTEITVTVA